MFDVDAVDDDVPICLCCSQHKLLVNYYYHAILESCKRLAHQRFFLQFQTYFGTTLHATRFYFYIKMLSLLLLDVFYKGLVKIVDKSSSLSIYLYLLIKLISWPKVHIAKFKNKNNSKVNTKVRGLKMANGFLNDSWIQN